METTQHNIEITTATATRLGEKLAGLDLTEEEGVLLTTLLQPENEVEGFGFKPSGASAGGGAFFDEVEIHVRTNVLGPLPKAWKPAGNGYLIITMEN